MKSQNTKSSEERCPGCKGRGRGSKIRASWCKKCREDDFNNIMEYSRGDAKVETAAYFEKYLRDKGVYNPELKNIGLSDEHLDALTKLNLKTVHDTLDIPNSKLMDEYKLSPECIDDLNDKVEKVKEESKLILVTNYLTIKGKAREVSEVMSKMEGIATEIHRVSFHNIDRPDIDNIKGMYLYNETYELHLEKTAWSIHCANRRGEDTAAILCQFTTNRELTDKDLLDIQPENNGLEVKNRWHMKVLHKLFDWQNPLLMNYKRMGYFSSLNGERIDSISCAHGPFITQYEIDTFCDCPECGEGTTVAELHINGSCPDCHGGMKAKLLASFGAYLETSGMEWSKGGNLCASDGCYNPVTGNQGVMYTDTGEIFCKQCAEARDVQG